MEPRIARGKALLIYFKSNNLSSKKNVFLQLLGYSDKMSFFERIHNTFISLTDCAIRRFIHFPKQMEIAEKHFGQLGNLPSIDNLVKNVSVILLNMHEFFLPSRPSMPGIVYIGGAHIEKPKPIPTELQTFLDEAKNGAIFFNYEIFVESDEMPPDSLKIFLDAFGQIKQRVLWNYNDEIIQKIPSNVMIRNSMPQIDILAHPNVVLFITSGSYSILLCVTSNFVYYNSMQSHFDAVIFQSLSFIFSLLTRWNVRLL